MAQLPSAVNDQMQGITWLCCPFLLKLLSNDLIQVLIQLVPGPDALIQGERAVGVGRGRGDRFDYLEPPRAEFLNLWVARAG